MKSPKRRNPAAASLRLAVNRPRVLPTKQARAMKALRKAWAKANKEIGT